MSWIWWKEKLDPDPLTRLNPDPIWIRIRNPARKREKAAATLLNSFFSTMSWICWKEKLDPDTMTLLNPDPIRIRNPAGKRGKSCFVLCWTPSSRPWAGSAGRRRWIRIHWPCWIRIQFGSGSATLPESEKKLELPCWTPSSRPWAVSGGRRSWIRIHWPYWNPDPIRIRIRNTAGKREKAAATLFNSFFSTMSWICWKEKLDPDTLTLLNPDSDPQRCQKARKNCCYLANLLLLDHELDMLEREAVLLYPDPDSLTQLIRIRNPARKREKSCFVPCSTPSSRPWAGSAGRRRCPPAAESSNLPARTRSRGTGSAPSPYKIIVMCTIALLAILKGLGHRMDLAFVDMYG